jgi:hypothetical protein
MGSAHAIDELNRRPAQWLTTDRVHRAGDPVYAGTSTLWNRAVTTRPAMAVRPRGAEVSISVTRRGSPESVCRCAAALTTGPVGSCARAHLVIDLGELRDVRVERGFVTAPVLGRC